ncbi:hypothetical protein DRQ20_06605 [bacterium]|nr:MAG: hypothetical protein DRQ20_06605 [bacterium]
MGFCRKKGKIVELLAILDGRVSRLFELGFIDGPLYITSEDIKTIENMEISEDEHERERGKIGKREIKKLLSRGARVLRGNTRRLAGKFTVMVKDENLKEWLEGRNLKYIDLNEISSLARPVWIPGDEVLVKVERWDKKDGIGYLPDGSKVVVKEGKNLVGRKVLCVVDSVLETPVGNTIFVSVKEGDNG